MSRHYFRFEPHGVSVVGGWWSRLDRSKLAWMASRLRSAVRRLL